MRLTLLICTVIVGLAALLAACGGDGDGTGMSNGNGNGAQQSDRTPGENGASNANGATTPSGFETARDALIEELESIGVNIGAVPDDVRDQLLESCRGLEDVADDDAVDTICTAIDQAIDTSDPGLVDRIVDQLGELMPR